jgi:hypothetical protein
MKGNEAKGMHCKDCTGTCCTFANNTMHITPLEAWDIVEDLIKKNIDLKEIQKELQKNIEQYHLDRPAMISPSGKEYRRSYTCPFFNRYGWGCGIAVQQKPYGCIAFNPTEKEVKDGGDCKHLKTPEISLHKDQSLEQINQKIKSGLELDWNKEAIPVATLQVIQALQKLNANVR